MKTIKLIIINIILFAFGLLTACKKDGQSGMNPGGTTPFIVRMHDAPTNIYTAVNVDIQRVEVITNGGSTISLNPNPGVYNLLDFANGKDTLIASANIPTGTVSQVRLILGSNNTVELNGQTFPLKTPSAQESGLKLNVHADLVEGVVYTVELDFDASKSIVEEGNGSFSLKPVIRVVSAAISGSIHGTVMTTLALPVLVQAVNSTDTLSTTTAPDGQFLISAVPAATYSLTLTPVGPFSVKSINSVTVSTGHVAEVGQIMF